MAKTSIYLNFQGNTEEAFTFYKKAFKTEFTSDIQRMKDVPNDGSDSDLPADEQEMVMHVELPITGGVSLMGTDTLKSMGHSLNFGDNIHINLQPDTRAEAERLFNELAAGGSVNMPLTDMFWGAYFGSLTDKFGVGWMVNCEEPAA